MKTKVMLAAIVLSLLFIAATPPSNGFDFVRSHRQGRGATITWAFTAGGATSFALQRTYGDPADPYEVWECVSNMNNNSSRTYKFTDENVFPGVINYRVVALMNDGTTTTSDLTSVRIVAH